MRIIAISDIHAHIKTFRKLIENQVKLTKKDKLFLLGDYVHRGPSDEGVLDYILKLQAEGYQVECLLGNHEFMWIKEHSEAGISIPNKYMNFFSNCKPYIEYEDFIFVHAGLNFSKENPLSLIDNDDLFWIRNWYDDIDYDWLSNRTIIHGHTPINEARIRKRTNNHRQAIGIDNGCFVNVKEGMGQLCALDLTNWKLYFQKNLERKKKSFFNFWD